MDLFFEIFENLKYDYYLWRLVRISLDKGISIRIFSDKDLIVYYQAENLDVEYAYLMAALYLVRWARRNEIHAKSSTTRKGASEGWLQKLTNMLDFADTANSNE